MMTLSQRRIGTPLIVLATGLMLSGCLKREPTVVALPPAPTAPVRTASLPPPVQPAPVAEAPAPISPEPLPDPSLATTPPVEVAAAPAALEVSRADLSGAWRLSAGGSACKINFSLTSWTGGNRASTQGCSSPQLANISAWELNGNTVTLKTGDTALPVASLRATQPQTFNGSTTDGAPITVSR
ncbi:AprI/Inh family metalloprotease inhibitor [Acuticoccus sp. MNP-M23]|uniref:AprI/Inh family metalloprotease inhibitor n=1 Tax=Acuticoccus sp. MNP-M23 TaxID=3072793 RepID=UPI0028165753|nr:AprI/Inh family metalloprotease inhibitor [Acuticoccus sp. MNP-M23]WMS44917.1 AprI/Inh family metalloprotease inhibitor [Acuticoccus sp. MNP-M23]